MLVLQENGRWGFAPPQPTPRQAAVKSTLVRKDGRWAFHVEVTPRRVVKADDELQIVWSEVYVPDWPDTHGEAMRRDELRKMAHGFLADGRVSRTNVGHTCHHGVDELCDCNQGCVIVESFVVRDKDPDFVPHSWVVAMWIPDPELWQRVKSGDINGFSMEALIHARDAELEIELPDDGVVRGKTGGANPSRGLDHHHGLELRFDEDGEFLGGLTTTTSSGTHHTHRVEHYTKTERAKKHSHRFSMLDMLTRGADTLSAA